MLMTPAQSPFDQLALIESALRNHRPDGPPIVIAMGIGMHRFGWDRARLVKFEAKARIGLRSDWTDAEMRQLGAEPRPRIGHYIFDNHRFVIVNGTVALIRLVTQRPAIMQIAQYANGTPVPAGDRRRDTLESEIQNGVANTEFFYALHSRLAERLATYAGVHLVFVEEVFAPDFITNAGLADMEIESRANIADFADGLNSEYWPIMTDAKLSPEDFQDEMHLIRGAAQERVQQNFARRMADFAARLNME